MGCFVSTEKRPTRHRLLRVQCLPAIQACRKEGIIKRTDASYAVPFAFQAVGLFRRGYNGDMNERKDVFQDEFTENRGASPEVREEAAHELNLNGDQIDSQEDDEYMHERFGENKKTD